jgi:hypothetical protein
LGTRKNVKNAGLRKKGMDSRNHYRTPRTADSWKMGKGKAHRKRIAPYLLIFGKRF